MKVPLFEIADIPGKGRGLIASCDIAPGTRILCERPLFIVPPLVPDALEIYLADQMKALPKEDLYHCLSLRNNFRGRHTFGGIVRTNGLPCGFVADADAALYRTLCLINHSCLPNSQHRWDPHLKQEIVHAFRPIRRGEEITIWYGGSGPTADRQAFLLAALGFQCECTMCSRPPLLKARDDEIWIMIQSLAQRLRYFQGYVDFPAEMLKDCHTLLALLDRIYEGYPGLLKAVTYFDALQICSTHGDQARASILAQRSYEARVICEGGDTSDAHQLKTLAERPMQHAGFEEYSSQWRSMKEDVPQGLDAKAFERWLFRIDGSA